MQAPTPTFESGPRAPKNTPVSQVVSRYVSFPSFFPSFSFFTFSFSLLLLPPQDYAVFAPDSGLTNGYRAYPRAKVVDGSHSRPPCEDEGARGPEKLSDGGI